jgi:chemotaxis protein MotA
MDLATIFGLLLAFGMMTAAVFMGGGTFAAFWDVPSILMVIGGTIGACLICFPWRAIARLPRVLTKGVVSDSPSPPELVRELVSLAETARRDGLLALENRLEHIEDPFIRLGVQLAIDGTRPETTEEVLRTEIDAAALRHKEGRAVFEQLGKFAPAFGMIGTLVGLIIMLGNMSDPARIGSGMAVALITTLYGTVLANGCLLPLAEKLGYLSRQERLARDLVVHGILAIQSGENPRLIEQRLGTYLPPAQRSTDGRYPS